MIKEKFLGKFFKVRCFGECGSSVITEGYSTQECVERAEEELGCHIIDTDILKEGDAYMVEVFGPDGYPEDFDFEIIWG